MEASLLLVVLADAAGAALERVEASMEESVREGTGAMGVGREAARAAAIETAMLGEEEGRSGEGRGEEGWGGRRRGKARGRSSKEGNRKLAQTSADFRLSSMMAYYDWHAILLSLSSSDCYISYIPATLAKFERSEAFELLPESSVQDSVSLT